MAKFTEWVVRAVTKLVDPEREERAEALCVKLRAAIRSEGSKLNLDKIVDHDEFSDADVRLATQKTYRSLVEHAWKDGAVSDKEKAILERYVTALRLKPLDASSVIEEIARDRFAACLANAMKDGTIDDSEFASLNVIAQSAGWSVPQFAKRFFEEEGERFLQGSFMAITSDGRISADEWHGLLRTTERLGFRREEMLAAIQLHARRFVEHVLVDAKADNRLSQGEEASLRWLLVNLIIDTSFSAYVDQVINDVRQLTSIADGKLPRINAPAGLQLNAGEALHFCGAATWYESRLRSTGTVTLSHPGAIAITDSRLLFVGPSKSFDMSFRQIIQHAGDHRTIQMAIRGKPEQTIRLNESSPLAYRILDAAIGLALQTKSAKVDGAPSRHIPREVRQRIWGRYGGRCAECEATDYLEYDHVIPVAKGGSNSDNNVQLLCRRCNLKKSDHI